MKKMQSLARGIRSAAAAPYGRWAGFLAVWLGLGLVVGCSSPGKGDSEALASVEIHGSSHQQVADMAAVVFHDHGYQVTRHGWTRLDFEKPGSTLDKIAYPSLMGDQVWERVKVTVEDVEPGMCKLECEAFVVRSRNQPLEEETRVGKLHSHKYRELLNEVAKRLSARPTSPS